MGLRGKSRNEPFEPGAVGIDFDGVLHSYVNGWTGFEPTDPPVPGMLDFLKDIIKRGYKPIIVSSRAQTEEGRHGIERWLERHGVDTSLVRISYEKRGAAVYIDDRGYRFDGDVKALRRFFDEQEEQHFPTWVAPPWKD